MDNQVVLNFNKNNVFIVFFTMTFCFLFFTKLAFADQYQLNLIVDLSHLEAGSNNDAIWLEPLTSPVNDDEFFVAKNNGRVYLVKNNRVDNQDIILDLPESLNSAAFSSLTAISLHPSFTLPETDGYGTFYTAHTADFDHSNNNSNNRITLNDVSVDFDFETVITAWAYDFDNQKIIPLSQREIIRIPIKTPKNAIQQLGFEPYLKPWNPNYGQLYLSLGYSDELKDHSLYSGAILRISPLLFGARNYTVSQTNPFVKTREINDEIALWGAQHIERFFWGKYSHESIFIQHNYQGQYRLSKSNVGDNLNSLPLSNVLMQQPNAFPSMLLYQGRNLHVLRNKMLYLTQLDEQWSLTSVALVSTENDLPLSEEIRTKYSLSSPLHLSILEDNQNEIIIFDRHLSRLYSLHSTNLNTQENTKNDDNLATTSNANDTNNASNNNNAKLYILFLALVAVLLSIFLFVRRNKIARTPAVHVLDSEYVRFEYASTKDSITLYKKNNKTPQKTVHLAKITRCEVLLNSEVINIIDCEPENVFSNQIETEIRTVFTREQNKRVIKEQTRQIQIIFSDNNDTYTICLYHREGNSRITGEKYFRVVDMIINICWIISKQLNPENTEARKVSVAANSRANSPVQSKETPEPASVKADTNIDSNIDAQNNAINQESAKTATMQTSEQIIPPPTDLVVALDKLVSLHKQGYLSDEEFRLAKANLLG